MKNFQTMTFALPRNNSVTYSTTQHTQTSLTSIEVHQQKYH